MRVLVVPKWYPWPDRPVFGIFCQEQARALATHHDVVVLASDAVRTPGFRVFELSDVAEDGLRTIRVRYRRPLFRPAAMACQVVGMLAALRRLRREGWRPEIVHAHVYSAGLPALLLGRLSGAAVVISEHYTGFQRGLITGYDRFVARLAFRHADLVAPVSEDLARQVRAIEPRARTHVVENVVDTDVFHPALESRPRIVASGPARLLTVAALAEKKGHSDLFEALAELHQQRRVKLDVVGDGPLRSELVRLSRRLGLVETVRFHGERSKADVAEFMQRSDLFVLPSLFENLPCVLIEAHASGLPFVATEVGGVPGLADGPGAFLCPPGSPPSLAETIITALDMLDQIDSPALARRAGLRFGYAPFERTWRRIYGELRNGEAPTLPEKLPRTLKSTCGE
jgi:glycosyltransferase involved in cell wall biosynthesis